MPSAGDARSQSAAVPFLSRYLVNGIIEVAASRDWQSFYHFTVGGPVEDKRLTTLPAYKLEEERCVS